MRSGDYPYPADEFDAAARAGGPRGVHRAPRSWWSRWWPFVIVLVVFPALAYAAITVLSDWDGLPGADEPPVTQPEDPQTEDPVDPGEQEPEPDPDETPEPDETAEPAPEPDMSRQIQVFNATSISGLAGGAGARLEDAGFLEVSTGNWGQAAPATSVVYYPDEADVATAELVAQTLGITSIELAADRAPDGIVVVLTADYSP